MFDTSSLRKLPDDFKKEFFDMHTSPLILIRSDGVIKAANQYKQGLLELYDEDSEDILLFAWRGQYKTDVFVVTSQDIEKFGLKVKSPL